jgi:hypothetical protein
MTGSARSVRPANFGGLIKHDAQPTCLGALIVRDVEDDLSATPIQLRQLAGLLAKLAARISRQLRQQPQRQSGSFRVPQEVAA